MHVWNLQGQIQIRWPQNWGWEYDSEMDRPEWWVKFPIFTQSFVSYSRGTNPVVRQVIWVVSIVLCWALEASTLRKLGHGQFNAVC